jgi:hypothetical protein
MKRANIEIDTEVLELLRVPESMLMKMRMSFLRRW